MRRKLVRGSTTIALLLGAALTWKLLAGHRPIMLPSIPHKLLQRSDSVSALVMTNFRNSDSFDKRAAEFLTKYYRYHSFISDPREKAYENAIDKYYKQNRNLIARLTLFRLPRKPSERDTARYYESLHAFINALDSLKKEHAHPRIMPDAAWFSDKDLTITIRSGLQSFRKASWNKDVPFRVFCNYVLPYRISDEYVDHWRQHFTNAFFRTHSETAFFREGLLPAATQVYDWLVERKLFFLVKWGINGYNIPGLPADVLDELPTGSCHQLASVGVAAMRALGIPATLDLTPCFANMNSGHEWAVVVQDSKRSVPFQLQFGFGAKQKIGSYLGDYRESYEILSKVYRQSFAAVAGSAVLQRGYRSYLPSYLNDPFLIDVTSQYTVTSNLSIPVMSANKPVSQWCYLDVFDRPSWLPVASGRIRNGRAVFENIGRGGVYLPAYITRRGMTPINSAFLLKRNGSIHFYAPDTGKPITAKLTRKFPLAGIDIRLFSRRMVGGIFQGADKPDFSDAKNLYVIRSDPGDHFGTIYLRSRRRFKYLRYVAPPGSYGNVAELEFYRDSTSEKPLTGQIIGTAGSYQDDSTRTINAAFDNDPMTFVDLVKPNGNWFGLELPTPSKVEKIRFLARVQDWMALTMINGVFQGANNPDFRDAVTLYKITDNPGQYYNAVYTRTRRQFRYLRYLGPKDGHCNVSEIDFYSSKRGSKALKGKVIGTRGSLNGDPKTTRLAAFDGDPTTFFNAQQGSGAWVGLEFTHRVRIPKIRFLARTDMNDIYPGNLYDLLYWDNKWISLGRVKADTTYLVYRNVPSNAVLWLRDLTTGREERIFTYEDGKQIWR